MSLSSFPITSSFSITGQQARAIWLRAQRLDEAAPFGSGAEAARRAVEHLGYVQIDAINVIKRSHHHILFTRIPDYRPSDLDRAQAADKTVFEYWTHALSYVSVGDFRFFRPAMAAFRAAPPKSFESLDPADYAAMLRRIETEGPIAIRDIDDDVLVEKTHPWGSRKPSRRALRYGFFAGDLVVSKRTGIEKTYDLTDRHFGWPQSPQTATEEEVAAYLLDRALRSQGLVSLDSASYGVTRAKAALSRIIDARVAAGALVPVHPDGQEKLRHWTTPEALEDSRDRTVARRVHILSPFDPLVIQRKRFKLFFGHEHRFEAYVPPAQRVYGYFTLPVIAGQRPVAVLDLKMDRPSKTLLIQKWSWLVDPSPSLKGRIDRELQRFEAFQRGA
ncbi:winged helix-turn-helix domain-containing protein [Azospirillum canadense]|uniref:winged helix-turn-helix domain-containing protein n=1 Tax=Azospirillum canadense TaxID=403962 RepID=UPI002226CE0A|nr:crosslink repair DNA glycosylase YcaQ family protein [Azospirillum canadense]MCW2241133.1 uncharacterized protein YcaQ [Azospirillum canadense]